MVNGPHVFLDTNVVIYRFDPTNPTKQDRAKTLLRQAIAEVDTSVSTQVVQEFINVILKKVAVTVNPSDLRDIVNRVLWPLCAHVPDPDFYLRALNLHAAHSLSWYDALIVQAALDLNCDTLYSEDLQAGQQFGHLTVKNPFAT